MINPTEIERARDAKPFLPFMIDVTDQRSFLIPKPNFVSVSPDGHTVVVFDEKGINLLDIMIITGIGYMTPSRNGGQQQRG